MRWQLLQALPLLLPLACGGGGGGSGALVQPAAAPALSDASLGVLEQTVALEFSLTDIPTPAALLQFDLAVDPLRLRPARRRSDLEMVQAVPTADSQVLDSGELRVLFGDGQHRNAQELREGVLLRLHLEPVEPRVRGEVVVALRNLLLVDSDGEVVPLRSDQVFATITIL